MVVDACSEFSRCLASVLFVAKGAGDDVDDVFRIAMYVLFDGEMLFSDGASDRVRGDEVIPADGTVRPGAGVAAWRL